jgi:protein involved in polysaccharide export with SLBB domain
MKVRKSAGNWRILCSLLLAGTLFSGCKSQPDRRFAEIPGVGGAPLTTAATAPVEAIPAAVADRQDSIDIIHAGDTLRVIFTDLPPTVMQPPIEDRVRDDGTIMLIQNLSFKAAGKSRSALEKEIREAYVPKYFQTLTVSVTPQQNTQFYYVDGEVKRPDRQVYIGRLTVLKAIASANGFTDFAHKSAVILTRADGRVIIVNAIKAQRDSKLDPEIYPGDKVYVERKAHPFQR